MDPGLLGLFGLAAIGGFLLAVILVLPKRRAPEEKGKPLLYEERCSFHWRRLKGGIVGGGNIPISRVSFYDGFFVVALLHPTIVLYADISSVSFKNSWISTSITIELATGRGLRIYPKNAERMLSIIKEQTAKSSSVHRG